MCKIDRALLPSSLRSQSVQIIGIESRSYVLVTLPIDADDPVPLGSFSQPSFSKEFFMPRCGATFDEKSVLSLTRWDFRGVVGVTHNLV